MVFRHHTDDRTLVDPVNLSVAHVFVSLMSVRFSRKSDGVNDLLEKLVHLGRHNQSGSLLSFLSVAVDKCPDSHDRYDLV